MAVTTKELREAVEATLKGVASKEQKSYSINGRSIERHDLMELIRARDHLLAQERLENRQSRFSGVRPRPASGAGPGVSPHRDEC